MNFKDLIHSVKGHYYFPRYSPWILVLLILAISAVYDYQDILFKPTQSVHQWRQCDCLSFTLNYAQDEAPLFEPRVHNLGRDGTGKTASEFPVLYYLIGKIWKLTGQHESIYRLLVLLLFYLALFALFRLFEQMLRDSVLAITGALLFFTSPTLAYYANNYLMDIPALSFAIFGLYFFFRFTQHRSARLLTLSMLFYVIGGLLKASSMLSFFAIMGIFVLDLPVFPRRWQEKVFRHPARQIIPFAAVIILLFAWYLYARHYNTIHNGGNFLIGVMPIWNMDGEQIRLTLDAIREHIKWDYFRLETLVFLAAAWLILLVFYPKNRRLINQLLLFLSAGFVSFIILFFEALKDHDYYVINLYILFPVVLLGLFFLLKDNLPKIYCSILLRVLLVAFLFHNIDFTRRRISGRYSPDSFMNREYATRLHYYREIGPYLDSLGIGKNDRVISISDNSINITLYLMNRKGWTNYNIENDSSRMAEHIGQGACYILSHEEVQNESLLPFFRNPAGEFHGIRIYDVRDYPQ